MNIFTLRKMKEKDFKRVTGVEKKAFYVMLKILKHAHEKKKAKGGRKNNLSLAKQLLITLEYLGGDFSYLRIAHLYGVSEATCIRTYRFVKRSLIQSGKFYFPYEPNRLKTKTHFEEKFEEEIEWDAIDNNGVTNTTTLSNKF